MYIIEKLKLNRFQVVAIPKASELFARFGRTGLPASSAYTGDDALAFSERKTEQIANSIQDYEQYAREQDSRQD